MPKKVKIKNKQHPHHQMKEAGHNRRKELRSLGNEELDEWINANVPEEARHVCLSLPRGRRIEWIVDATERAWAEAHNAREVKKEEARLRGLEWTEKVKLAEAKEAQELAELKKAEAELAANQAELESAEMAANRTKVRLEVCRRQRVEAVTRLVFISLVFLLAASVAVAALVLL